MTSLVLDAFLTGATPPTHRIHCCSVALAAVEGGVEAGPSILLLLLKHVCALAQAGITHPLLRVSGGPASPRTGTILWCLILEEVHIRGLNES